ncbi:hypothetical protein [Brevundimonas sp.]|uniref:hypothetical protein n=1 Tax=Brevundimonas sp. TaxID=1871086 RepID=UPI0025C5A2E2|nr:hypothetical protein [Brevundimonas sp.]
MCDGLGWFFNWINSIQWLEVIKAFAAAATALVAFFALRNWRRQDKAKRQAEFLDALIEAAHTYIAEMPKPIILLEMAKIGMKSHAVLQENDDETDVTVRGAIAYIQKNGEQDAKRILEALEAVQPSKIKLKALATKGQVFNFYGYSKCQNTVTMLTWHFDRIEAFMVVTGSPTWNWNNSTVMARLKKVMAIDPSEIRESVQENNVALLEFASDTYKRIYG